MLMFGKYMWNKARNSKDERRLPQAEKHEHEQQQRYAGKPLSTSLRENNDAIINEFGGSKDIALRELSLKGPIKRSLLVVYIEGLVSDEIINEHIIKPIQEGSKFPIDDAAVGDNGRGMDVARDVDSSVNRTDAEAEEHNGDDAAAEQLVEAIRKNVFSLGICTIIKDWGMLYRMLLLGGCIIMVEGCKHALSANVSGGQQRGIEEPRTEMTIRGPREGFTETMTTNLAMLRRRLRSPKLWVENKVIGEYSQTPISIVYIKGLADENILADLRERLDMIEIDGILESNYIEELISDQKWTLFPTIAHNERPDVVASYLLEGRVGILIDGTPFALLLPAPLNSFFQAAEDYYQRYDISTFLRMLRFISFIIALLLPSVYVAIVSYHQEMIPTQLLIKLAAQREGVPFPAYLEAFIMEFVFEILREAVLRMPSATGNTISIVGALVIGQSVVEAGIMSPSVVIVVSLTAISSFVTPAYSLGFAARLLRFLLLLASSTLGFYGIGLVVLLVLLHLSNLRTFGVPYLKPIAPFFPRDMKDTFVRVPLWLMNKRPRMLATHNQTRENSKLEQRKEPTR